MAEVERNWFRPVLAGEEMAACAPGRATRTRDFDDVATADVTAPSRPGGPSATGPGSWPRRPRPWTVTGMRGAGQPFSLRWVIVHMIEEYARHNGHADLLRERIDGATGL